MKTLIVPKFDNELNFIGYKEVKIKNKPNSKDYNKIASELPGFACGYCFRFYDIVKNKKPIEITGFYDLRQKGIQKLRNHFLTVKNKPCI